MKDVIWTIIKAVAFGVGAGQILSWISAAVIVPLVHVGAIGDDWAVFSAGLVALGIVALLIRYAPREWWRT